MNNYFQVVGMVFIAGLACDIAGYVTNVNTKPMISLKVLLTTTVGWLALALILSPIFILLHNVFNLQWVGDRKVQQFIFWSLSSCVFLISIMTVIGLQLRFYKRYFFPVYFCGNILFTPFGLSIIAAVISSGVLGWAFFRHLAG